MPTGINYLVVPLIKILPASVSAANFWIINIDYNGENSSDYQSGDPLSFIGLLN